MKKIVFINLILFHIFMFSQNKNLKSNFTVYITEVRYDFNKDNLLDKVLVTQDTINKNSLYKLEIFFANTNGDYKLIVSSTKIIEAQYFDGRDGFRTGNGFEDISIKNGVVSINCTLLRGHFEHKYRFQNGNFTLIGYSYINSNGQGVNTVVDFNLSTGIRIVKLERYDRDEVISITKEKLLIRPLPKLQNVEPSKNELF